MTRWGMACLAIAIGLVCGCAAPAPASAPLEYDPATLAALSRPEPTDVELANIRNLATQLDPELSRLSREGRTFELAMRLRELVYMRTPVRNTWQGIQWSNYDMWVYSTLLDPEKGHLCMGLAVTYGALLRAFDIPHRAVSLFDEVAPIGNGHNSIEVLQQGRWVVADPTFNTSFANASGMLLSWAEVRDNCQQGREPEPVMGQGTPAEDRSNIGTYPVPVCDLSRHLAVGPSSTSTFATIPTSWDGVLHMADGSTFDVEQQLTHSEPWVTVGQ